MSFEPVTSSRHTPGDDAQPTEPLELVLCSGVIVALKSEVYHIS